MTIRNLDQAIEARLGLRAAKHGRSIEEEARGILRTALCEEHGRACDLATAIGRRPASFGGSNCLPLERTAMREPPALES